jgi:catechol 2,3-dioxygenase-like lactoylglutathione lyase family enzyme
LVKKTVNFDDPGTYHLYYGNATGAPGTILTFFPFADAGPGRAGAGMAASYAYAVPKGGFDDWMLRLAEDAVDFLGPKERFGQRVMLLRDPDGAPVELIETDRESDAALDGFHSVTLWQRDPCPDRTASERHLRLRGARARDRRWCGAAAAGRTRRCAWRGRGPDAFGRAVDRTAGDRHDPPRRLPRRG